MKCLIDSWTGPMTWSGELMPETAPLMLKIGNKPLLEFYLDYCVRQHIGAVKIILRYSSPELRDYFQDGGRWGISIGYAMARPDETLDEVLAHNRAFVGTEPLLLIRGLFFLHFGEQLPEWQLPEVGGQGWCVKWEGEPVWAAIPAGKWPDDIREYPFDSPDIPLSPLASVRDYFHLNMRIIQLPPRRYVLPGYNNDDGISLGQGVELAHTCRLNKPVMIADGVHLEAVTSIGPNAIIGTNVLIDRATAVADAIVCDHSYVGADLEIRHKIIYRNHLIDPETGFSVDIVDNFLLTNMAEARGLDLLTLFFQRIPALLLLLLLALPYLGLRLLAPVRTIRLQIWKNQRLEEMTLTVPDPSGTGWVDRLRRRLCVDKFKLLIPVLKGQLFLTGNRPLTNTLANAEMVRELKVYHPAAFPFIETIDREFCDEGENNSIYEFYYSSNFSWLYDLVIVGRIILRRLWHG
ncbi:MAG: hypothetical protein PHQ27_09950 [Victivallales bacterium]|nr:hypothetical protein [Victivallales bacterium]